MFQVHKIDSLDHPSLAPYRTMRRPADHVDQGIFVAEGERVVRCLLQSPTFQIVSLIIPRKWIDKNSSLLEARSESVEVFVAEKKVLEDLIGFEMFQGVLAVGRIPPQPSLESVLNPGDKPHLLVATDALANAANMGAVVRNCAAFGVQALIVGETCSPPWLRRSVRSSMGTIFDLPIIESVSLAKTLADLQTRGIHIVGAHPQIKGPTLTQVNLTRDVCIVVGSEGDGLRPEVLKACSEHATIPMQRGVDSINVTSAATVFLYEVSRQRGKA